MEDQDDDETLKELKSQKAASEQLLKEATKELKKCLVENNSVRSEKRQWKENPEDRDKHYRRVYYLKFMKRGLMLNVRNAKEQLQATKREIDEHLHPASTTAPSPIMIVNSEPCLHKADVYTACCSFKLCLILEDPMDTYDANEPECRLLPPILTLGPKGINQQSGLATYTASLVKKKKKTVPGHQTLQSKQLLSGCSLRQSANTNELDSNYREHEQCREPIRSLYYSNSQCKKKRRLGLKAMTLVHISEDTKGLAVRGSRNYMVAILLP
ncbi:hypothetical protein G6F42_024674 [Rhizopus arrhizus]|nr:hypothetical protein G6F42_024674 [Rhizopus arrhizus]